MDHISQDTFLTTLATGCPDGLHLVVVENGKYFGKKWNGQPLKGASYFSTGFSVNGRRRDADIGAVRCVVLGDIGTKVDAGKVLATPSWVMETSKGNFQYGYLLDWPSDLRAVESLVQGLADAGLTDAGEKGASRLNRVPGSINTKEGKDNFISRVVAWRPDLVYTLKTLAAALDVKPGKLPPKREHVVREDLLGSEDLIFNFLVAKGLVVKEKADGWWEIVCPFADEHEGDRRQDASYKHLGSGGRAVKCFHGHGGNGLYTSRFFAWVIENGGPKDEWREPHFDIKTREALAKITSMAYTPEAPMPLPRKQVPEPAPGELYTIGSLRRAIGVIPVLELPDLKTVKGGAPKEVQKCTYDNIEYGLRALGVQVRLNLMTGESGFILPERVPTAPFGHMDAGAIDTMTRNALLDIFSGAGISNKNEVMDGFVQVAHSRYWHPMKDWIESKPWDGKDRIQALLGTVQTPSPELFSTYFRRWLLQGVEAACGWSRGPSQQKGLVLVLAGAQGIGKTRWLMSLVPPGFGRAGKHLNLNGHNARDSIHQCLQGAIVELGELDSTFRKSDMAALKAFVTDTNDEYRLPYAKDWMKRPRSASLCGSVNDGEFLNDPTGSRRFLGVEVTRCNAGHEMDMQQVWAQVHADWLTGEQWWLTPEEEAMQRTANKSHTQASPAVEVVLDTLEAREDAARYPLVGAVGTYTLLRMLDMNPYDPKLVSLVSGTVVGKLGKRRDLRHLSVNGSTKGMNDKWAIRCTVTEQAEWSIPLLKAKHSA